MNTLLGDGVTITIDVLNELMLRVCDEWDKAEGVIKRAELILCEPVIPSILELRYAGRRIVEAKRLIIKGDQDSLKTAQKRLQDALFDCRRAQHDAIDVMASSITLHVKKLQRQVPPHMFTAVYPEYPLLLDTLDEVYDKIVSARESREKREEFYQSITTEQMDDIQALYSKLLRATPKIRRLKVRDRLIVFSGWILLIILFLFQEFASIAISEIWELFKPERLRAP